MKTFGLRVAVFLLLQAGLLLLVRPDWAMPGEKNYLAATIDKHRLLRQTSPPRILLLGGSNVPFGIQSDRLERELGRPVVNLGLIAGVGLDFMLNEVAGSLGQGDWVILSPEHDLLDGGSSRVNQQQILEYRPASLAYLPFPRAFRLVDDSGLAILGGALRRALGVRGDPPGDLEEGDGYSRRGFNRWGDYVGHYARPETLADQPGNSRPVVVHPMDPAVRSRLGRFVTLCEQRGARCFYTCPPQPRESLEPSVAAIEANLDALAALPGLDVLDRSAGQVYPLRLFYDTGYHLTEAGARQRTERILEGLRRHATPRRRRPPGRPERSR